MKKVLISTEKLCKTFSNKSVQQHVLKNLDIQIYQGDFTVIMGASGAGKSTLLHTLSGMDRPSLGKIIFSDMEIQDLSNDALAVFRRKSCGFVFQSGFLLDNMSIMDNVMVCGLLVCKDRKVLFERATKLFESVGLSKEIQNKFPSQLSGGEAQRAAIVRAMINEPKAIFADEPTGALNSASGKAALDTLTEANHLGQSIVMVTHDLRSARRGNRILYMRDGIIYGICELGAYVSNDKDRHEKLNGFLEEMGW